MSKRRYGTTYKFESMEEITDYLDCEKVECLECGKKFINLGLHTHLAHDLPAEDYKLKYNIPLIVGLVPKWKKEELAEHAKHLAATNSDFGDTALALQVQEDLRSKKLTSYDIGTRKPLTEWHVKNFVKGGQKHNAGIKKPDSVFFEFCKRIATGRTVVDVGNDPDMPSFQLLYQRCKNNETLQKALDSATSASETQKEQKYQHIRDLLESGKTYDYVKKTLSTSCHSIRLAVGPVEAKEHVDDYQKCVTCGVDFKINDKQRFRYRKYRTPFCCTASCSHKLNGIRQTKPPKLLGPCPGCGKMFESKKQTLFCSKECYVSSPQYKEMMQTNYKKGHEKLQQSWAEKMKRICPVCNKEFRATRSHQKYCSPICYRGHKAIILQKTDINTIEFRNIDALHEFMSQDSLSCIVEGCQWTGKHLGSHLSQTHGILASEAKKALGLNLSTGLVNPETHLKLKETNKERGSSPEQLTALRGQRDGNQAERYTSEEAKQNRKTTRLLKAAEYIGKHVDCRQCGRTFQQKSPKELYCSTKCRSAFYTRPQHDLTCTQCGGTFTGNKVQERRQGKGLPVTCSIVCRNTLVSQSRSNSQTTSIGSP